MKQRLNVLLVPMCGRRVGQRNGEAGHEGGASKGCKGWESFGKNINQFHGIFRDQEFKGFSINANMYTWIIKEINFGTYKY